MSTQIKRNKKIGKYVAILTLNPKPPHIKRRKQKPNPLTAGGKIRKNWLLKGTKPNP